VRIGIIGGGLFTGTHWEYGGVLIDDGKVVAMGSVETAARGYKLYDFSPNLVIPGLVDSHMHLLSTLAKHSGSIVDLFGVTSMEELRSRVLEHVRRNNPEVVVGIGWDQELLGRTPRREDVDEVLRDRPIILYRSCGHVAVANTPALELMGITSTTPDPPGGLIGRDEGGRPNGLLYESALRLANAIFQMPTLKVEDFKRMLLEMGITAVTTMAGINSVANEVELAGDLYPIRVFAYPGPEEVEGISEAPRNFIVTGVKVFADGSLGGRTAYLREPYEDARSTRGVLRLSRREIAEYAEKFCRRGLQLAVHAIGDGALEEVLSAAKSFDRGCIRVEHASVTPPDLLKELSGMYVSVQPHFVVSDSHMVLNRLGIRALYTYAYRTLLTHGVKLLASSDSPVEPIDPWLNVWAAVTRGRSEFGERTSGERLDVDEALRLYTGNPFELYGVGMIERGLEANLVVLNRDDLSDPRGARSLLVVVGDRVYEPSRL